MLSRSVVFGFLAAGAVALAGCGANNASAYLAATGYNQPGSSSGYLRVVNGSPDIGTIDAYTATPQAKIGVGIAYGYVSAYTGLTSSVYTVGIYPTGANVSSTSTPTLSCVTPVLTPGIDYTLVVSGKSANGVGTATGLQCHLFNEPTYTASATTGLTQVNLHHASPAASAAGETTLSFGSFKIGGTVYNAPAGSSTFNPTLVSNLAFTQLTADTYVEGATAAPGVAIYADPGPITSAPATAQVTLLPSNGISGSSGIAGANNTNETLPYSTSDIFSIYAIDAPAGSASTYVLIGLYDT